MTEIEKGMIGQCKVIISGEDSFSTPLKDELSRLGFEMIMTSAAISSPLNYNCDILITDCCEILESSGIIFSQILAIDFKSLAVVFVLSPEVELPARSGSEFRSWAARYIEGYISFWNMEGYDNFLDSKFILPNKQSSQLSMESVIQLCARIAANLAVGRTVKKFPRFYLIKY